MPSGQLALPAGGGDAQRLEKSGSVIASARASGNAVGSNSAEFAYSETPVAGEILQAEQRLQLTESLLEEHHAAVYRYAYRLCLCSSAADDIAQDVFLRAFKSIHQLKEPAAARSWLYTIARNEFSRWCKKRHSAAPLDAENIEDAKTSQPAEVDWEQSEWINRGLSRLAEEYRVVVAMYYFDEMSYAAIASALNIPLGTVMSRLSRAKKYLKEELNRP